MCAALPSCFNKPPGEKYIPMLMLANVDVGQCCGWPIFGLDFARIVAAVSIRRTPGNGHRSRLDR